eukprot:14675-Heterococcus_DN1.PRE.13
MSVHSEKCTAAAVNVVAAAVAAAVRVLLVFNLPACLAHWQIAHVRTKHDGQSNANDVTGECKSVRVVWCEQRKSMPRRSMYSKQSNSSEQSVHKVDWTIVQQQCSRLQTDARIDYQYSA